MSNRILVIDDELIIRENLRKLLTLDGYDVVTAGSGLQGLDLCNQYADSLADSIKVVVLDVRMPGMDGMEVLRRLKSERPQTEVIIITGDGSIDSAIQALRIGAFDYITKPIEYEELALDIVRALQKQEMQRRLDAYMAEVGEARAYAEKIIAVVPYALSVLDSDLWIKDANETFFRSLGVTPAEVVGKRITELVCDSDGYFDSALRKVRENQEIPTRLEFECAGPNLVGRTLKVVALRIVPREHILVVLEVS